VRRQFYDIAKSGVAPISSEALQRIAALYAVEEKVRGHTPRLGNRPVRPIAGPSSEVLAASRPLQRCTGREAPAQAPVNP
jgi:hypothetical protein